MTNLFTDIAHRIDNAHEDFTDTLIRCGEFDSGTSSQRSSLRQRCC